MGRNSSSKGFTSIELGGDVEWGVDVQRMSDLMDTKDPDELAALGGVTGLASLLNTDTKNGITDDDDAMASRISKFGLNQVPEPPSATLLQLMWENLHDPTLIILMAAAAVSLPVGVFFEDPDTGWIEGTAILVSVFIVVMVASVNDFQKEKQFRDLNRKKNDIDIKVIRDGKPQNLSIHRLLVGDVVQLETGDMVPCDGVLFKSTGLKILEAAMTGEADEIKKEPEKSPFCISTTKVVDGMGSMIAVAVGTNSKEGRIKNMMADKDTEETLLQKKLTYIAELIGKFGFAVGFLTFVVLTIGYLIKDKSIDGNDFVEEDIVKILDFVITGLTIVVVAVPEGLPLAVTISMAFSVKKMLKDNNLVRHLDACEVMGGATTICSDKTGTLTRNKMAVVKAWIGQKVLTKADGTLKDLKDLPKDVGDILVDNLVFNSTARISYDNPEQPGVRQDTGNKTECALLELAKDMGHLKEKVIPDGFEYEHLHTFSSARKRMSCVIKKPNGKVRVCVKGASEVVLRLCTSQLQPDGKVVPLSDSQRDTIQTDVITKFASEALRTICIAYKDVDASQKRGLSDPLAAEQKLTCVAIVGIEDPVRDEVPAAVEKCRRAGIVVRMVTGDNLETAQAIAKQCKLVAEGKAGDGEVMEGPAFRNAILDNPSDPKSINMAKFRQIVPKLRVLARSSPADKYSLVKGLRETGEVVAVTGDGTNDAPALHMANVGLSMGIQGTEVAKEASDIILLDDNFNSIVSAVKWGRNVFDSISKFVQFQLTVNIVAIVVAVTGAFTIQESPLTAVQMLWVNLIMDTLASLALATEEPSETLLKRRPYHSNRPIVSAHMRQNIIGQSVYQLVVLLTMLYAGHDLFDLGVFGAHHDGPTKHFTMVFNTFVMLQIFNEINSRKIHGERNVFDGFFGNPYYVWIILGEVVMQFLLVQFGGLPMNTVPLNFTEWVICTGFGAGSLLVGVALHSVPVKDAESEQAEIQLSTSGSATFYRGYRRRSASMANFRQMSSRTSGADRTPFDQRRLRSIVREASMP